jgi:hypothetical protein
VIVLDAGALIALDRDDRTMWARLTRATNDDVPVVVPVGALAQAWRGGARQALLARALQHTDVASFDDVAAAAGALCGAAGTADVIDASVAVVAAGATTVCTSDPDDLRLLLHHLGAAHVRVVPC